MNIKGHIFKKVTQFKHLKHILTQENNLKMEFSTRVQKGN